MRTPIKRLSVAIAVTTSLVIGGPAAAQTAPAPAQPEPAATQTAPAAAQAAPGDASAPKRVAVGASGFFQPGLLLQGWFLGDRSTAPATTMTFQLRRAEISAKGEIVPGVVGYGVMFDPVKVLEFQDKKVDVKGQEPAPTTAGTVTVKQPVKAASVLQDFWLTVPSSYVDVSLGQVKIPVSMEGWGSSAKLLFPERALVSKQYGDKRDIGLRLTKTFKYFGYYAGLFNGAGPNATDTNNDKDVTLRVEGYPVQGLVIAGVVYSSIGKRQSAVQDRYEGDLRFERGPFLLQAEYIRAHDVGSGPPATDGQGFYGAVAWTFLGALQPCVRVGFLDTDIDAKKDVWHYDAGLNYYLRKNEAKLQLSYSRFQNETGPNDNQVILAGQVWF